MKTMKKIASLVLAMVVAIAMAVPTMAASITVSPKDDATTHKYQAYQIFSGTLAVKDGNKILSDIEWGNGVNGSAILTALQNDTTFGEGDDNVFKTCSTAAEVAEKLKNFQNDAANTVAFSKIVGAYLTTMAGESNSSNKIENLTPGYYLVKEQAGTLDAQNDDAYTRFILEVLGDEEVDAKSEVPTVDKKIDGAKDTDKTTTGAVAYNNAAIGDTVPYVVTSKVPDMTGYDKYYFVVNDTMSGGLTFQNDIAIKVGDKTLENNTDYTVTVFSNPQVEGTDTAIKIVFKNFIQYKANKGADIIITYSGKVNASAVINGAGNPNTVDLIYSNNPTTDESGNPGDEPGNNSPTGKTPEKTTRTFVTEVVLKKTDGTNKLTGAEFKLTGTKLNIVKVTGDNYVQDSNGTYWLLKDGTYTTDDPNAEGMDQTKYKDTTTKYKKETTVNYETKQESVEARAFVDAEGQLKFTGLSSGTYSFEEIVAPSGYNKLKNPITLTIGFTAPTGEESPAAWSYTWDGTLASGSEAHIHEVVNQQGTQLPSTGGMGTTIFYVVGCIMVIAAGVILVSRRRMKVQ